MARRKFHSPPQHPLAPVRPGMAPVLIYALGQLGWSLGSFGVGNLLVYFYMPPEQGDPMFPAFIYQGPVLAVFTLIGIVSAGGRLLDALIDPFIANWSDRKSSVLGKRRWFLLLGALPLAAFGYLVFTPLAPYEKGGNFAWLMLTLGLFYFFFAFYVIPYTALIAELGHTEKDRMRISTLLSVTWAIGFIGGNSAYALQSYFESTGMDGIDAFQRSVLILQSAALVLMLIPALFLNERRYARQSDSTHSLGHALRMVLSNNAFWQFLKADLMYWLALSFIQLGIGFYTTLLLGLDKSYAFVFSLTGFVASFLFYWPVNVLAARGGKQSLLLWGFAFFAAIFATVFSVRAIPLPKEILLYGLAVASAFPLAAFGILPNALIGDLVEKQEQAGGERLSGMFYGVRAFVMKVGIAGANLIFPSLLLFGKSTDNPWGVQLTALAALLFCIAGWMAFRRFRP